MATGLKCSLKLEWRFLAMAAICFGPPAIAAALPPPPTGVTASDGAFSNRVQVSWAAAERATAYAVWRTTNKTTLGAVWLGTIATRVFNDTTAVAGVKYYYWIKARNTAGLSGYSAPDAGYRLAPPAKPAGVSASDGTFTNQVRLRWSAVSQATQYEVFRRPGGWTNAPLRLGTTASSFYDDLTAVAGTVYYYWVRAKNAAGLSGFSLGTSGYRAVLVPAPPAGVTASDGAFTNRVQVSWAAAERATAYAVWRTTNKTTLGAVWLGTIAHRLFNDTTAVAGVKYYYWIKARNTAGLSGYSAPDSGYRLAPPAKPTGVSASDATFANKVRITWNTVSQATHYEVFRRPVGLTNAASRLGTTAERVYDDPTARAGTLYNYWVRAWNAAGRGLSGTPDTGCLWVPITKLNHATPVSGLSGVAGSSRFFSLVVPPGQQALQVTTVGGAGDCDVYVKFAGWPQTNTYNARSIRVGNAERAQVINPASGTWYVLLYGRGAFSGATLQAGYYPWSVTGVSFYEQAAGEVYGYDNFSYYWPWKSLEFIGAAGLSEPVQLEIFPSNRAFPLLEFVSSAPAIAGADPFQADYDRYGYPTLRLPLHSSVLRGSARIAARFNNTDKGYCYVATYPRLRRTVAVTLVHESGYRATDLPDAQIQSLLEQVYLQAVVELVLVRRPARTVGFDRDNDGALDVSAWMTFEMQLIRDACKSEADYNIFIVSKPADGNTTGMMGFRQKYGFVFGDLGNARTVAHELGHGLGGLLHTPYDLDNIMYNYESGTKWRLRKDQWDSVNP